MKRTIQVYLGEQARRVGTLHHNTDGARENAAFEYDRAWLSAPDCFAIEPALPLVDGPLTSNLDDHLLNHGFLHVAHGQWRLAPAFDLNPFPDRVRELKTWISPDTGPEATLEALHSVTPYFKIPKARARDIEREVERATARWREVGQSLGMTNAELEPFVPAFEHTEREAAR